MNTSRFLIEVGVALIIIGVIVHAAPAFRLGRLPGDISLVSGTMRFYLPIGTSFLLSALLTIILSVFSYMRGK